MTLSVEWETLDRLIADGLEDLAVFHWEEAEIDKEHVPLDLDFTRAKAFEKAGQHRTAALRRDKELVGYAGFTVMTALFHRSTLHAFCHSLYVSPDLRGFASLMLINWCEDRLAELGVVKMYLAARTPRQCDLFAKLGYTNTETMFSKLLGAPHGRVVRTAAIQPA